MKLAHIINPVKVPPASDLFVAQPITFKSIKIAHNFVAGKMEVALFSICYAEDAEIIPPYFKQLPVLQQSVQQKFAGQNKKKLPFIKDILNALANHTDADYLAYTNVDIALMPQFYEAVKGMIAQGHDAILINRRSIPAIYKSEEELPLMYAELGEPHPGFDCFIFHRSLLPKFILGDICIGIPFLEITLLYNMVAFSKSLKLVDDKHLTFHIGTEVMVPRDRDLYWYNRTEYEQNIYPHLQQYLDIRRFPYAELALYKRILKWALNPSFRTQQVAEMEGKNFLRKLKYRLDLLRFRWLDSIR